MVGAAAWQFVGFPAASRKQSRSCFGAEVSALEFITFSAL
jgi:hypothetical protein